MKRSIEQNIQSAFNRYMFDSVQANPTIITDESTYNSFLELIDYFIVNAIITYRKHNANIKDFEKTIVSRQKRCNEN